MLGNQVWFRVLDPIMRLDEGMTHVSARHGIDHSQVSSSLRMCVPSRTVFRLFGGHISVVIAALIRHGRHLGDQKHDNDGPSCRSCSNKAKRKLCLQLLIRKVLLENGLIQLQICLRPQAPMRSRWRALGRGLLHSTVVLMLFAANWPTIGPYSCQ